MINLKKILRRIYISTAEEPKGPALVMIKLQEEVGELAAEIIKKEGYTYKEYNKQDLLDEISDVLITTLALYFMLRNEGFIPTKLSELKKSLNKKIDKWETKIPLIKKRLILTGN
jgi:NTP pyrophosphatase (non-canonical NTP hydrolase)